MSGSKEFGVGEDFPQKSPSAGKPILQFNPDVPRKFIELLDTFLNYAGKAGKFVVVNDEETGLTVVDINDEVVQSIADKNYVHVQTTSQTLWTITHNMGKYPSVRLCDDAGVELHGDVHDVSINELTIEFSASRNGKAILN